MATERSDDLRAFKDFIDEQLANGGVDLTLNEALDRWEYENSPQEERDETIRAIQRGLDDMDTGRTVDAFEFVERMRQKSRTTAVVRTFIGLVIIAMIGLGLGYPALRWLADPPNPADVAPSLLGHDTVYPEGYTDSGWRRLRRGMATADVGKVMGAPIHARHYPGFKETWVYSKSGSGNGNYWSRNVIFKNGRIDKTNGIFYVD